jgi:hypothetical protein
MRRTLALLALAFAWSFVSLPALAQSCCHHGGDCSGCAGGGCCHHGMYCRGGRSSYTQNTNPNTGAAAAEETHEGRVLQVDYLPGATKDTAQVQIHLQAGAELILAKLGPSGFLRQNGVAVREGDTVSLTGYWVSAADGDLFIVTRIANRNKTIALRDKMGDPLW